MSAIDFEEDAGNVTASVNAVERVTHMAGIMVSREEKVKQLELQLKEEKIALKKLQEVDLPELMAEIGLSMLGLPDGSVIEIKPDIYCGINEERREKAHQWLIEHSFGGLIKTEVTASFGKGELEQANEYARLANEAFPDHQAIMKDSVHPATLKSFVKEQLAIPSEEVKPGNEFPKELFGVTQFNRAVYTPPKS